jgi:hypothetical protein
LRHQPERRGCSATVPVSLPETTGCGSSTGGAGIGGEGSTSLLDATGARSRTVERRRVGASTTGSNAEAGAAAGGGGAGGS